MLAGVFALMTAPVFAADLVIAGAGAGGGGGAMVIYDSTPYGGIGGTGGAEAEFLSGDGDPGAGGVLAGTVSIGASGATGDYVDGEAGGDGVPGTPITFGQAADGSDGGNGGAGGSVTVRATALSVGSITLVGGNAGTSGTDGTASDDGRDQGGNGGSGGNGGDVGLIVTDALTLSGDAELAAGASAAGANGGTVKFSVGNLVLDNTVPGTALFVVNDTTTTGMDKIQAKIDAIDATQKDILFQLSETTQWDSVTETGVFLGNLKIDGGRTIGVDSTFNGGYTAKGDIEVLGKAARLNMNYDASGAYLHFVLPADIADGETMLLMGSGNAVDVSGANVRLTTDAQFATLTAGETIILIDATTGTINGNNLFSATDGLVEYLFELSSDTNQLLATLAGARADDTGGAKSLLEGGPAVRTMLLNIRQDHTVGSMQRTIRQLTNLGDRLTAFAVSSYDHQRGRTGGHVDLDAYTLSAGLAKGTGAGVGRMTVAAFFEGGWGDYDSRHNAVRGDGDASYLGGGLLGRFDFCNGFHIEASFALGRVKSDYRSRQLDDARFDSSTFYYGGHAGAGKVFDIGERGRFELDGKLLHTRQSGDEVVVLTNYRVRFDAVTSLRGRLGARYAYRFADCVEGYAGAAWEYEFKAKDQGSINGLAINPRTRLQGHTGIAEAGLNWRIDDKLTVAASARALIGKRRGVGGGLAIGYVF